MILCFRLARKLGHHLLLVEFVYSNSYPSTTCMVPFKALYGNPCCSPSRGFDTREPMLIGPNLFLETIKQVVRIKKMVKEAQDRQKLSVDLA